MKNAIPDRTKERSYHGDCMEMGRKENTVRGAVKYSLTAGKQQRKPGQGDGIEVRSC